MNFIAINLIISFLIFLLIIGIGLFIQVKLSRSKNKYLGLIMPILSFFLSVLLILIVINGTVSIESNADYLGLSFTFLVSNIPTIILVGIYLSIRNRSKNPF